MFKLAPFNICVLFDNEEVYFLWRVVRNDSGNCWKCNYESQ